jgi:hypothetical protein
VTASIGLCSVLAQFPRASIAHGNRSKSALMEGLGSKLLLLQDRNTQTDFMNTPKTEFMASLFTRAQNHELFPE